MILVGGLSTSSQVPRRNRPTSCGRGFRSTVTHRYTSRLQCLLLRGPEWTC